MIPSMNDHHGALDEVTFEFVIKGHADDTFTVLSMQLVEPLGDLYEGTFELVTEEFDIAPQSLLEQPACAVLRRAHRERRFHGVVRRVEDLGVQDVGSGPVSVSKRVLRVWLVPRLWLLSQRVDCRIYQELTATEVFLDVIRRTAVYDVGSIDLSQMATERAPIEYVVQYNESDLDFLRRLSQREGFWLRFVQGDDAETIALHDGGRETELPDVAADYGMIVPVLGRALGTAYEEGVRSVEWHRSVVPTRVVVGDHDLTRPQYNVRGQRPGAGDGRREVFRHPGPVRFGGYTGSMYERDDAAHLAGLHYAAASADALAGEGTGNVLGFGAGNDFRLSHLPSKRFVLTHVTHEGEAPELLLHTDEAARGERYRNTFRCLDATRPLALAEVTPKPLIAGPQTATVVGPPGEDIYTDEHGRIKVQFHWDRYGASDERSTCWLRVAQAWGGGAFGAQFIPRAGMEVVVCFLDGDPDRPLAIGCVYPQTYDWPFLPPGHKNRAGVRTNTVGKSPMDRRYNELSFDDTPDHEEVFVHASRNLREEVVRDRTTFVGRNQTLRVKGDLSIEVSGRIQIDAGESILLQCGDSAVSVSKGSVKASHQTNWLFVGKEDDGSKGGKDVAQLTCDGAFIDLKQDEVSVQANSLVSLSAGTSSQTIERSAVGIASKTIDIKATSAATLSGLPVQLQGPGLFAARVTDPAPAAILMGAALVQVGGPSFPFPVERLSNGILKVGARMLILPSGEDRDFQAKVLRDLGIMASTPSGLVRLQNIENAPGDHSIKIRHYTVGDANRINPETALPYGEDNSLCTSPYDGWAHRAPDGSLVRGDGAGSTVTYNPDIVTGVAGDPAPADATLFHELGHAEHNLYGTNRRLEEAPGDPRDEWNNYEEWQTIEGPINQPADAHANDFPDVPYSPSENEYLRDRQYPYRLADHGDDYVSP